MNLLFASIFVHCLVFTKRGDLVDHFLNLGVLPNLGFDLFDTVQDCGVVTIKPRRNLGIGQLRKVARQIHSELAWDCKSDSPRGGNKIRLADVEILGRDLHHDAHPDFDVRGVLLDVNWLRADQAIQAGQFFGRRLEQIKPSRLILLVQQGNNVSTGVCRKRHVIISRHFILHSYRGSDGM